MTTQIYQNRIAFDSASTKYKENRKKLIDGSPDQISVNEILLLQLYSAHAFRNDGYAKKAANQYVANLGSITVKWVDEKSGKQHDKMQELWEQFCETPMLDGYGDIKTWQSLANYSRFLTGANFTRKHIRRTNNENIVPLKLEVVDSRLHDIGYFGFNKDTRNIKFGIKFIDTKPETYYFRLNLYNEFPFNLKLQNNIEPIAIPANELIHSFIRTQPGQWIGIPELAAILTLLYKIDDLVDVTLAKQAIAQAVSIIITGSSPQNQLPVGGIRKVDLTNDKELDEDKKSEREAIELKTSGTNILYPKKGENVSIFQGTDIGENLLGLLKFELRRICAGVDVPYHQVTGDLDGINFSSLRAIIVELRNRIEFIHFFYTIPLEMKPLTKTFKDLAVLYNKKVSSAKPTFQLPIFRGVDDLKDAQGDLLEIISGLDTIQNKWAERHLTEDQINSSLDYLKARGILDNSNNKNLSSQSGNNEPNSNSSSN